MALSGMERTMCNKMVSDFDKIIGPVAANKNKIKQAKRDFENKLDGFNFSSMDDINSGEADLKNKMKENLPGDSLEDMRTLQEFMDRCPYLSGGPFGENPIAMLITSIFGALDKLNEFLSELGGDVPEYDLGGIGSFINKLLSGLNLPGGKNLADLLKLADKLIECLAGVCGEGDPQYILIASEYSTTVNDLYSEMNITSDPNSPNYGKFDYQTIYDNAVIGVDDQLKITKAMNVVDQSKDDSASSINSSIATAKSLMKGGFF